jgi:hypothetical protein
MPSEIVLVLRVRVASWPSLASILETTVPGDGMKKHLILIGSAGIA